MLAWEGGGTLLPLGFTTLRIQAKRLQCWARIRLPAAGRAAAERCIDDPVHLLCRALRMAPPCYRQFELVAGQDNLPPRIAGGGWVYIGDDKTMHGEDVAQFDSMTQCAAAMRRFAAAEGLSVHVPPDERSIIVRRVATETSGDGLSGGSGHVQ